MTAAARAFRIREELRTAIVHELRLEPVRVIASDLGITERGARDIQTGSNLPRPEHLVVLAREYPNIHRAWLRCVEDREDGE